MKIVKMQKNHLPLVAIIGRVNVGKSTLFNKLIERQKALVSKIPGTTRDLNFGVCEWRGCKLQVVDTGGLFETNNKQPTSNNQQKERVIREQVEKKARGIIEKSDLLLFMVDAKVGILQNDRLIAQLVKKSKKTFLLVTNKIDKINIMAVDEFKKLGLGEPVPIAAASGVGLGDLLDKVIKTLKHPSTPSPTAQSLRAGKNTKIQEELEEKNLPKACPERSRRGSLKITIIGKPNVGKSSLLNKILGEEKVIVSPVPHTTREPQDTLIEYDGHTIELIDTAGIRRKARVGSKHPLDVLNGRDLSGELEKLGIAMSIKALKKSEIALFVLDISENLTNQDAELARLIIDSGISLIFVANKYDHITLKHENTRLDSHQARQVKTLKQKENKEEKKNLTKILSNYIYGFFPFLTWAPIIFTSALTGKNCQKILSLILEVKKAREKQIDEKELNEFLKYLIKKMPPPRQQKHGLRFNLGAASSKKSRAYISKLVQVQADRPIFELHITNITKIPESYLRYFENNIRERFGFLGTPIKIRVMRNQ